MKVDVAAELWPLRRPFVIARESIDALRCILVTVERDGIVGRGEAAGVDYRGETPATMIAQVEQAALALGDAMSREQLLRALPPGGARNALDCALWDWEAKASGRPVWAVAGLREPTPVLTAQTIGLDTPAAMADAARAATGQRLLKLKLGAAGDVARAEAVRAARPDARLIVDVNEGWTVAVHADAAPKLAMLGVELIEQPLPAGSDAALAEVLTPVPLCADESFEVADDMPALAGRYAAVNIKLDKAGGLTAAIAATRTARAAGLKVMIGNMLGTSLAMAPALLLAGLAEWVDLDGPLWLAGDRSDPLRYESGLVHSATSALWG